MIQVECLFTVSDFTPSSMTKPQVFMSMEMIVLVEALQEPAEEPSLHWLPLNQEDQLPSQLKPQSQLDKNGVLTTILLNMLTVTVHILLMFTPDLVDLKDPEELLDLKDPEDLKVVMDPEDLKEHKDLKDSLEHQDQLELKDPLVNLDLVDLLELMDFQDNKDPLDRLDPLDLLDQETNEDPKDLMELLDLKV